MLVCVDVCVLHFDLNGRILSDDGGKCAHCASLSKVSRSKFVAFPLNVCDILCFVFCLFVIYFAVAFPINSMFDVSKNAFYAECGEPRTKQKLARVV